MKFHHQKVLAYAVALTLQLQAVTPAWAALAQVPLISTSAASVSPNVVLTLDNSESMALNHMPEDLGGTNIIRMHPDDNLAISSHIYLRSVAGHVPATGSCAQIFECKMRSSGVNTIYYNPAIQYLPWIDPKNPGGARLPASSFDKAPVTPGSADTTFVDLRFNPLSPNRVANWCTAANNCNSATGSSLRFNPGIFYKLNGNPELAASYKLYDLNAGTPIDYGRATYPNRKDCPETGNCTLDQEKQNFANWFTYYRARILFTKAAVSEAFAAQSNKLRLGWGFTGNATTSNTVDDVATLGGPVQGVREFTAAYKIDFLKKMQDATLVGSTPLRYAMAGVGAYFKRQDKRSPWYDHPERTSSGNKLACRRAYNILTTDGYYNDNGSVDSAANFERSNYAVGEVDNTTIAAADGTKRYEPTAPYSDGNNANSLADIAMYYWANDLQSGAEGIENRVPTIPSKLDTATGYYTPGNDPATWQHLTQFTVGIGVSGSLDPTRDLPALQSGARTWPAISNNASKIDDLWHAAVNSRGKFFQVSTPKDLSDALTDALTQAVLDPLKHSGVATTTLSLENKNDKYVPEFNAAGWTGDVKAYEIDKNGDINLKVWRWSAVDKLPEHSARNIWTWNPNVKNAVTFTFANLTAAGTASLLPDTYRNENFVGYIRGSSADEGIALGNYRPRTSKLGDFINSTPVFVKGISSIDYKQLGGEAFTTYVGKKAAREGQLFIGGNDGMLHAFAETTGVESFAYVPQGVIGKLDKLANQAYGSISDDDLYHQYYVDGPLTEADAYIATKKNTASHWSNVIVGTLGAGGNGIFAIDVTGSADGSTNATLNGDSVLWEITGDTGGHLGKITSPAQVGVLQNGGWKVLVGNGYDSTSNRAALLVIDLKDGSIDKTIVLGEDTGTQPNGLGGVTVVRNSKNEIVSAYAGDLQGNLWRVDFSDGKDASTWTGKVLFTAQTSETDPKRQPITAPPVVGSAAGARMVIFGTGRLLTKEDQTDSSKQTIYAIWDDPQRTTQVTRGNLVQQTISKTVDRDGFYTLSSNPVTLGAGKDQGWFIDLTIEPKQRVIYPLQVIDSLVFIPSLVPAQAAETACESKAGHAYNFMLPVASGAQLAEPVLDTNGDGVVTSDDTVGLVYRTDADGPSKILIGPDTGSIQNTGEKDMKFKPPGAGPCAATESCPGSDIKDRIWKQLVNPPF